MKNFSMYGSRRKFGEKWTDFTVDSNLAYRKAEKKIMRE